jgi:hypothetical protein
MRLGCRSRESVSRDLRGDRIVRRARPPSSIPRPKGHEPPPRRGGCRGLRLLRTHRAIGRVRGVRPAIDFGERRVADLRPAIDGASPIGNFFDHDKPIDVDANGYVLTLCGAHDTKQVDGHPGYDWRMPEATPLFAVADAVVLTAGLEAPHFCPQVNRTVQALLVQLVHTAPTGESYVSVYGHLSRVDVQEGVFHQRRHGDRAVGQHRLQRHTASALRRRAERRPAAMS